MPVGKGFSDYDDFPDAVKATLTREQWAWMPDSERAGYLGHVTAPDPEIEDEAE